MSQVRLDFTELRVGEYTPFDLFDAKGRLVLQKGVLLADAGRVTQLSRLGLWVRERDAEAWRRSLMRQVDVMAQAGATVQELGQAEPERSGKPAPAKSASEQVREWLLAWDNLVASEATQGRGLHRSSAVETEARWKLSLAQAGRLADAQPDLAHYCLVRSIYEHPGVEAEAEREAAQHLLWWLSARRVARALGWDESAIQWLGQAVHAGRCLASPRPGPAVAEAISPGALAVLQAWRQARSPLAFEQSESLDASGMVIPLADRLGVWLGAAQALHGRRPSCLPDLRLWMALAKIHAGAAGVGQPLPAWQRMARASEILLQRQWGPHPCGSFVELANGDVAIAMRAVQGADPLLLRLRGRSGMPYIDLPFRNAENPGHAITGALAEPNIGMRLSHEKLLLRAFAV